MLVSDLIRLASVGGGFKVDCKQKMVSDIIRIVAAARNNNSVIVLENTEGILLSDKIRIAAVGAGCVFFNESL